MNARLDLASLLSCNHSDTHQPARRLARSASAVLLLQGPIGPFFDRISTALSQSGAGVRRIAFSGGDMYDSRDTKPDQYLGTLDAWPGFLTDYISRHRIDLVMLFGQSRPYHVQAIRLCKGLGIHVIVLDEGYFRPGYVTLEVGGINARSSIRDLSVWVSIGSQLPVVPEKACRLHFQRGVVCAIGHYLALWWHKNRFQNYQHHRQTSPLFYAAFWLNSWKRKLMHLRRDAAQLQALYTGQTRYFFVPLQDPMDSQVREFSPYQSMEQFVDAVLTSFQQAPISARLLFKQHPMDRGSGRIEKFTLQRAAELGLARRIAFVTEGLASEMVKRSAGVLTINSSVGLMALKYRRPLLVLGEAVYSKFSGVYGGCIGSFWSFALSNEQSGGQAGGDGWNETHSQLDALKYLTQLPAHLYESRAKPLDL